MFYKILNISLLVICTVLCYFTFVAKDKGKIAFVRSQTVLEKYHAMDEAKSVYEKKIQDWQEPLETLQKRYDEISSELKDTKEGEGKNKLIAEASRIEYSLGEQQKALEEKAKTENERLTRGVLDQVNSFIKEYAEKNGYQIVFGVTLSGNILYGNDAIDITSEIIDGLNKAYKK